MIENILEATKLNLEGDLSRDERCVAELLMCRMLDILKEYRTMIPLTTEYVIWFAEYRKERFIESYVDLNRKNDCGGFWE